MQNGDGSAINLISGTISLFPYA